MHIGYKEALKKHGLELVKALPPRIQDKCMQGITLVKVCNTRRTKPLCLHH